MEPLIQICKVSIPDTLGEPEIGPDFHSKLNQKNSHGSGLLIQLLGKYAHSRTASVDFVNEKTYDDYWELNFRENGACVTRIWFNLRRFNKQGTEWGIWTDHQSEFTDGIRDFMENASDINVAT